MKLSTFKNKDNDNMTQEKLKIIRENEIKSQYLYVWEAS
jgi:hypothetical protein